jgi:hypothetical protein
VDLRKLLPPTTPPVLPYELVVNLLEGAATKALFGRPKVTYPRVIAVKLRAFELGAVIGYVYRDALEKLAPTFMTPGHEPTGSLRTLRGAADDRVIWYDSYWLALQASSAMPQDVAKDLLTFFVMTELQRNGTPALSLTAWQRKEVEVAHAYQSSVMSFVDGVAFGAAYADRLSSMWRHTWEHPDDEVWATWKAFGLPLNPPQAAVRFEDRCADLQAVVEITVRNQYPHIKL